MSHYTYFGKDTATTVTFKRVRKNWTAAVNGLKLDMVNPCLDELMATVKEAFPEVDYRAATRPTIGSDLVYTGTARVDCVLALDQLGFHHLVLILNRKHKLELLGAPSEKQAREFLTGLLGEEFSAPAYDKRQGAKPVTQGGMVDIVLHVVRTSNSYWRLSINGKWIDGGHRSKREALAAAKALTE